MTKTVAVPVELLERAITAMTNAAAIINASQYKIGGGYAAISGLLGRAEQLSELLSAPVVDEPASYPNTNSAGQSIARCSQSHSEAGWCGTDDCYRRNR